MRYTHSHPLPFSVGRADASTASCYHGNKKLACTVQQIGLWIQIKLEIALLHLYNTACSEVRSLLIYSNVHIHSMQCGPVCQITDRHKAHYALEYLLNSHTPILMFTSIQTNYKKKWHIFTKVVLKSLV